MEKKFSDLTPEDQKAFQDLVVKVRQIHAKAEQDIKQAVDDFKSGFKANMALTYPTLDMNRPRIHQLIGMELYS